jgi:hypothetical protein
VFIFMTDESQEVQSPQGEQQQTDNQKSVMFSQEEVEQMMKDRLNKLHNEKRLREEENDRLRKKLEELQKKQDSGTATIQEREQLQDAKQGTKQAVYQGYSKEDVDTMVNFQMKIKELDRNLSEAEKKDPELAKLMKEGNTISPDEAKLIALPDGINNGVAIIKQLLKDGRDLNLFRTYISAGDRTGLISYLNDMSKKLEATAEKPHPSGYTPSPQLPESEGEQDDLENYIKNKY